METSGAQDDSRFCDNCHQSISKASWLMHEARCRRINMLCPLCNEVVLKDRLDEHREEYHTMEPCDLCNKPVERWLLDQHKSEECWKRFIVCSYCKTEVTLADFSEHEHACSSRTDECYVCHKYIMLKNMENHLWEEHREGSGPVVPHNSPTHERKGGGTGSARESPVAMVKTYGRMAGAVSRKMGVSQPAREKKAQAESNVNSANQQFNQLSGNSREVRVSSPPLDREGSPLMYRERVSAELALSAAPPSSTAGQQQQQEKTEEGEEDPNTIPCESCGKNIPIPDFIEHQQACDPWAFLQSPPTPPISNPPEWEEQRQSPLPIRSQVYTNSGSMGGGGNVLPSYEHLYSGTDTQGEGVLCEACNQYIPFSQWRGHKDNCRSFSKSSFHVQGRTDSPPAFEDAEETLIPCQFCAQPFAKSALQQHQVRCMADTQPFYQNDVSPREPSSSPPLHTQDLSCDIPCEYCSSSVPASMLCEHQAACDENPLVKAERQRHGRQGTRDSAGVDRDKGKMRQCQFCHKSFTAPVFRNHKILCTKKPKHEQAKHRAVNFSKAPPRREEPPGEANQSCYHCGLVYPLVTLRRHEDQCLRNPKNTPSSRYEEELELPLFNESRTQSWYDEGRRSPAVQPWLQEDQRDSLLEGKGSPPSSSEGIPCEFCGESFAIAYLYSHQASCPRNPDLQVGMPALEPLHNSDDDSDFPIPCEFCGKQLSFAQVHSHQVQCEVLSRS